MLLTRLSLHYLLLMGYKELCIVKEVQSCHLRFNEYLCDFVRYGCCLILWCNVLGNAKKCLTRFLVIFFLREHLRLISFSRYTSCCGFSKLVRTIDSQTHSILIFFKRVTKSTTWNPVYDCIGKLHLIRM